MVKKRERLHHGRLDTPNVALGDPYERRNLVTGTPFVPDR
jgi:hypothetical protein